MQGNPMQEMKNCFDEFAPILLHRAHTKTAYRDIQRHWNKIVRKHVSPYNRPLLPQPGHAADLLRGVLRSSLGVSCASPEIIVRTPSYNRSELAGRYFHSSEKIHVSNIITPGGLSGAEECEWVKSTLSNYLMCLGIDQWQFAVATRVMGRKVLAKIGLPGANYVRELVSALRQKFPLWRFSRGRNHIYERRVESLLSTVLSDCIKTLCTRSLISVVTMTQKAVLELRVCPFIDGWKNFLYFLVRLVVPVFSPARFFYEKKYHATSRVVQWKGIARCGERNIKENSSFSYELEAMLGRSTQIATSRGQVNIVLRPGVWVMDNKALWYASGVVIGSMKDIFRRYSRPWMWTRCYFIGESIFSVKDFYVQYWKFDQLVQKHIQAEISRSKKAKDMIPTQKMTNRAFDYAETLIGQKHARPPIISNGAMGMASPLMQMLMCPPLMHAILHQIGSTVELAHILMKEEKGLRLMLSDHERLQTALSRDLKPKAAYIARKLSNLMSTSFSKMLYELPPTDARHVYWAAFHLHGLFTQRIYDGARYSPQNNFRTMAYSALALLLFQDLAAQQQLTPNPLQRVHWGHMYSFAAFEWKYKLVLSNYLEERFEGSFADVKISHEMSRQPSAMVKHRQRIGMNAILDKKLPKHSSGTGWHAGHRDFVTLHNRDILLGRCVHHRLFPRHIHKATQPTQAGNICKCWVCVENQQHGFNKKQSQKKDPPKRKVKCCNMHKISDGDAHKKYKNPKSRRPSCPSLRAFRQGLWHVFRIATKRGQGAFITLEPETGFWRFHCCEPRKSSEPIQICFCGDCFSLICGHLSQCQSNSCAIPISSILPVRKYLLRWILRWKMKRKKQSLF
jgi:hypothetical protein